MAVGKATQDLCGIRSLKKTKRNEDASEGADWGIVSEKNKSIQFSPYIYNSQRTFAIAKGQERSPKVAEIAPCINKDQLVYECHYLKNHIY
jgi:hypothetical protein